jgi:hypothetical protein
MSKGELCVLPGGYLDPDGVCHRHALIEPLRGRDEDAFQMMPATMSETHAVSELLTTAVRRIGTHPMTREVAGALTAADRDYLLLKLWQFSFSPRADIVLTCPRPSCRARMDMDFDTSEISPEPCPQEPLRVASIAGREVAFRVPLADDITAVAVSDRSDPCTALLARCVRSIDGSREGVDEAVAALPVEARAELAQQIERACPRLEAELDAACPECGGRFEVPFDPSAHLLIELRRDPARLERDVHALSLHYHWPLSEILQMPRPARRRYVRVLARELAAADIGAAVS